MKNQKDWILENIKRIMRSKGMKLEIISNAIGKSPSEFSKILNGKRREYTQHLVKIAEALEVSFHELVYLPNAQEKEYIGMEAHKEIVAVCNTANQQTIDACNQTIELLKTNLEKLQVKYDKLKNKLFTTEKELEELKKG